MVFSQSQNMKFQSIKKANNLIIMSYLIKKAI